ncbi:hypothetical protein [Clostridium mediterraneense]|uniref:hypothetical protein n=1 Tax=Clostridium mediterraneense TaxID=1805472 RepID=UPI00082FE713|nr:hypothetical protein [Clostridium mediterraneense]
MKKLIATFISIIIISSILMSCTVKEEKVVYNNENNIINNDSQDKNNEDKQDSDKNKDKDEVTSNNDKIQNQDGNNKIESDKVTIDRDKEKLKTYFEKQQKYFISNKDKSIYNGYAETGFTLGKSNVDSKNLSIKYSGQMTDGYGEDERGKRLFSLEYNFKYDEAGEPMIYQRIRNKDYLREDKDTLVSIIKNYIVMWGEPFDGDSWSQKVIFKGKEYTAKTVMSNVKDNSYTLTTIINDIEGFKDKTYKETRNYEKGVGLVSYEGTPYYIDETDNDLLIGYRLSR